MRVVLQRVSRARVTVGDEVVSSIGRGLVCLCGLCEGDTHEADLPWMTQRILQLQLWPDAQQRPWKESVLSLGLEVLLVSQFTLYAEINRGRKPDLHRALRPDAARSLYADFVESVRAAAGSPSLVKDGRFGAMMQVELVNDGPITMVLESPSKAGAPVGALEALASATALASASSSSMPRRQMPAAATAASAAAAAAAAATAAADSTQPDASSADPAVLIKRLEKKLVQIRSLRQRVETGDVTQLKEEQILKLASEQSILLEIKRLQDQV
jgi:D-tyrosyl-tRNA(Tyr) deacylase